MIASSTSPAPRVLHAVVENAVQRSGRLELRRRLLEAIVNGQKTVSWEWKDGRLQSPHFRQGVDLQCPSPDEDWPSDGPRCLFDLWTNDVRYLANWPRETNQASGSFTFLIEDYSAPVSATYRRSNNTERVEIELENIDSHGQEAAKRALLWHERCRIGNCPVSPFDEQSPPSPPPTGRKAVVAMLPGICITILSALLGITSFVTFEWSLVVGSFVWGLAVVPLCTWFALNWLVAQSKPPITGTSDANDLSPTSQRWSPEFVLFLVFFFVMLLLPAIATGIWLREPEAVSLAMASVFGFMTFVWLMLIWYHPTREPPLEPL